MATTPLPPSPQLHPGPPPAILTDTAGVHMSKPSHPGTDKGQGPRWQFCCWQFRCRCCFHLLLGPPVTPAALSSEWPLSVDTCVVPWWPLSGTAGFPLLCETLSSSLPSWAPTDAAPPSSSTIPSSFPSSLPPSTVSHYGERASLGHFSVANLTTSNPLFFLSFLL